MITELDLPYPPSINHYFSYYQGRPVLSKDARSYRHQVRRIAISAGIKPFMGALAVRIDITRRTTVDVTVTMFKRRFLMRYNMPARSGTIPK